MFFYLFDFEDFPLPVPFLVCFFLGLCCVAAIKGSCGTADTNFDEFVL
jgi:hypothetical protein